MMNQDDGFHQRWELRNVAGDSSSDDEGSPLPTNKIATNLVLFRSNGADDDDEQSQSRNGIAKAEEKKLKSNKKKNLTKKKKSEGNRKRKHRFNEEATLKDLKIFADSLVRELTVAHANMFAHMRDEMRKLVASDSVKKKVGASKLQNQRDGINLINDHSTSRMEFCKMMAARSLPQRLAELKQQEQIGGFALNYHKAWGLYGESRSLVAGRGVGLPVPLHRGMVGGSSRSSLSFLTRFPSTSRAPSERMVANGITGSVGRISEGEFQQGLKATK